MTGEIDKDVWATHTPDRCWSRLRGDRGAATTWLVAVALVAIAAASAGSIIGGGMGSASSDLSGALFGKNQSSSTVAIAPAGTLESSDYDLEGSDASLEESDNGESATDLLRPVANVATSNPLVMMAFFAVFVLGSCGALARRGRSGGDMESPRDFQTDLDTLRQVYPLGNLAVTDARWRYFAQAGERIVEAVFRFDDPNVRESLLVGSLATVSDIPAWYPEELLAPKRVTIAVSRNVANLPGIVSAFPDIPEFVRVTYTP